MSKIQEFISPAVVSNLGNELLNLLGNEVSKADTSLYERKTLAFRDIIDANFPTMLVVDYANIKQELSIYKDIETGLQTYISKTYKPTAKDYDVAKFSDAEITMLLRAIKLGMQQISATPTSYKQLQVTLSRITQAESTGTVLQQTKQLFSKVYKLTDVPGNLDVFIFPNFARIGDLLRKPLEIGLSAAEEEAQMTLSKLSSIGSILAYGHTAAGYIDDAGNAKLNFNSPKSLAVMFDVIQSASESGRAAAMTESLKAATFFVNDTRQTEVFVTIDKDFSEGFVKAFVSVGGNIVRFENSLINSRRGSVLEKTEKRGVNKAVLDRLATAFRSGGSTLGARLARYIVNKKSSPNLLEYVAHLFTSALKNETASKYKGSSTQKQSSKKQVISKQVMSGVAKKVAKLPKLQKPRTPIPSSARDPQLELFSLQSYINANLADRIRENMGTGNRRDILNYRSGRFAESVKVERLSESRQGMITAFYSYMKNPYATFSDGGRQQYPKTRDPKLLISKSIREIAAEKVANRLRAVVV